jgi:hypothetical protein
MGKIIEFFKRYGMIIAWGSIGLLVIFSDNVSKMTYICMWVAFMFSLWHNEFLQKHLDFWRKEAWEMMDTLMEATCILEKLALDSDKSSEE